MEYNQVWWVWSFLKKRKKADVLRSTGSDCCWCWFGLSKLMITEVSVCWVDDRPKKKNKKKLVMVWPLLRLCHDNNGTFQLFFSLLLCELNTKKMTDSKLKIKTFCFIFEVSKETILFRRETNLFANSFYAVTVILELVDLLQTAPHIDTIH